MNIGSLPRFFTETGSRELAMHSSETPEGAPARCAKAAQAGAARGRQQAIH